MTRAVRGTASSARARLELASSAAAMLARIARCFIIGADTRDAQDWLRDYTVPHGGCPTSNNQSRMDFVPITQPYFAGHTLVCRPSKPVQEIRENNHG